MNISENPTSQYGDIEHQDADLLQLRGILRDEIKDYTRLSPARGYIAIAVQWACIVALVAFAVLIGTWWSYLIVLPLIAGRQHALGVLGHDGAHYRLSNNKALNDWTSDYLCMLPTFFSINRWRAEHITHHRFVNTSDDPYLKDFKAYDQWHWPKTRIAALKVLLGDLFGLALNTALEPAKRWGPFFNVTPKLSAAEKFRIFTFYPVALAVIALTGNGLNFFILWLVPMLSFAIFFVRWRTIAEHLGMGEPVDVNGTRHVDAGFIERLFFSPCGINYHIDHHIFPGVPFYNLPRLHQRLLQEPVYRDNAIIMDGYFGKNSVYTDVVKG
jgi:fatty acid desaturase